MRFSASYMLAAAVASVAFHATTGLFAAGLKVGDNAPGIDFCPNGDSGLIGKTALIAKGCYSAVSVFTVDYDAPSYARVQLIRRGSWGVWWRMLIPRPCLEE